MECSDARFDEDSTAYIQDLKNEDSLSLPPEEPIYEEVQIEPLAAMAPDETAARTPDEVVAARTHEPEQAVRDEPEQAVRDELEPAVRDEPEQCRRRIPAAAGAVDATPSGVSRVRVTRTVLRECDIGLHRTVTVDSHRRRTDTRIRGRRSPL